MRWGLPGGLNLSTTSPYGAFFSPRSSHPEPCSLEWPRQLLQRKPAGRRRLSRRCSEDVDNSGNFLGMLGSVTAHANDLCTSQSVDLTSQNFTVLNHVDHLLVWVIFGPNPPAPTDPIVAVSDVRLTYQLQVSRPPLNPTFSDVPSTDPGFRYIEALVASGVTAGCGGGNYCPDQMVTRLRWQSLESAGSGLSVWNGRDDPPGPRVAIRPVLDTVLYEDTGPPQLSRYLVSGFPPTFESAVDLPAGAVLDSIGFDFCDDRPPNPDPLDLAVWGDQGVIAQLDSVPGGTARPRLRTSATRSAIPS